MEKLAAELLQASSETDYIVHHEPTFTMKIGQACAPLKSLMDNQNAQGVGFITAWNPFSQRLTRQQTSSVRTSSKLS